MTMTTVLSAGKITDAGLILALRRIESTTTANVVLLRESSIRFCLEDAARYIHEDNKARGWWTDLETGEPAKRNVGEMLMLMVSEIAEIPEGTGLMTAPDDKLPDRLMFEVELADCAIRIFDTVGALAPDFWKGYIDGCRTEETTALLDSQLLTVVRHLVNAMEAHRKGKPEFDYYLGRALHMVFRIGSMAGLHVADAMVEKLRYNAQRADHQIENRIAAGGKKY